jgi:serine/threonine protein kinase
LLKKIGKYKIERLIGEGSTSLVYLAHDPNLSTQLAIKVFDAGVDDNLKKMQIDFLNESQILFSLSSAPHVVSFMEFDFTASGQPYIVMPYFKKSLADLLGTSNKIGIKKTLGITNQILSALNSIHQAGLVHRDIKPSNILLDDNDHVQVADFGISMAINKLSSAQLKASLKGEGDLCSSAELSGLGYLDNPAYQTGLGSLYYSSPEQLNGDANISEATDIYALSALIYRCLTGLQFIQTKLCLSAVDTSIDEELSRIVELGLSVNPALRPSLIKDYNPIITMLIDNLSKNLDGQQTSNNEANLDPERTRVWEQKDLQNNELDQLKLIIENLLLEEGEISETQFSRIALLAEAELHKQYSDEWLIQTIQQTKIQLSLQNKQAAKFFLWIDQLNAAIADANGHLKVNDRHRLISLAATTLSKSDFDLNRIIERKLALKKVDSNKTNNKRRRQKGRFVFVLVTLVCAFTLPWLFTLENEKLLVGNQGLNSVQNQSIEAPKNRKKSGYRTDQNDIIDLSTVRITDSLNLDSASNKVQVILSMHPSDADVVIQSKSGLPVTNSELTKGEYRLRISKNGYKTVSKNINITTNRLLIDDRLQLGDTRYFIGNTDRTVADGIPVEFILLPQKLHIDGIQNSNAPLSKKRLRIMSFEVTNQLYSACVGAGKCPTSTTLSTDTRYLTFAKPQHPVVNVSWYDINEKFIPWLVSHTASDLRLPTAEEWEFAAASNLDNNDNMHRYSWGQKMSNGKAHCKNCNSGPTPYASATMPVRSFAANKWQLYDFHGNVQEWTSTCPEVTPSISSSNARQRCDLAVTKGGSWLSSSDALLISYNDFLKKTVRSHTTGFRLVEEVASNE